MKNHNLSRYKKLLPIKVTVSKKLTRTLVNLQYLYFKLLELTFEFFKNYIFEKRRQFLNQSKKFPIAIFLVLGIIAI